MAEITIIGVMKVEKTKSSKNDSGTVEVKKKISHKSKSYKDDLFPFMCKID